MQILQKTVRLHRAQAEFRRNPALYRGFVGGRGSGKSWVGAYDLIRRAKRDRSYLVGSPTSILMGDTTFPTFKALAQELGVWESVKLTPYPNVLLTTGATVRFRTAEDPEKMRGPNLSGVWLDEASLMPQEAFDISIASLREGGEQGWLSATFTPKGIYHWTYEVFAKRKPNTALIRASTGDNPFNPPDFEATLVEQYSDLFARQELGGEFLEIEGAEWPSTWFPESIWFDDWPRGLQLLVLSLDPSKGKGEHGDYSAFVVFGRDAAGTVWTEADMDNRRPTTQIVSDGLNLYTRIERETDHRVDGFGIESNAFQELLADEFIRKMSETHVSIPIYKITNSTNKELRIRTLTPDLRSMRMRFRRTPGTRLLVRQLQEFPVGNHDDGPDALEMARRLAIELWNGKVRGKGR